MTAPPTGRPPPAGRGAFIVAVVLSVGMCVALNVFTAAAVVAAFTGDPVRGLSENGTQILAAWGGGILGVIGAAVGYQVGATRHKSRDE
jgi:hypothetical protein